MPLQIRCPSCEATLRVPDNLLGRAVKCPRCKTTFTAADDREEPVENVRAEPPPRPSSAPRRPPARQQEEEIIDDYEEEEEEERPRRRRKGGRRAAAAEAVKGPAIALMVAGGGGLLLAIANVVLTFMGVAVFGAAAMGPRGGGMNAAPDVTGYAIGRVIGTILSFCWPGVVLSGAIQMMRLQSFGYAMTACIVAMLPCNLCCLLGLPFGIWGLVVLLRSDVKNAF